MSVQVEEPSDGYTTQQFAEVFTDYQALLDEAFRESLFQTNIRGYQPQLSDTLAEDTKVRHVTYDSPATFDLVMNTIRLVELSGGVAGFIATMFAALNGTEAYYRNRIDTELRREEAKTRI